MHRWAVPIPITNVHLLEELAVHVNCGAFLLPSIIPCGQHHLVFCRYTHRGACPHEPMRVSLPSFTTGSWDNTSLMLGYREEWHQPSDWCSLWHSSYAMTLCYYLLFPSPNKTNPLKGLRTSKRLHFIFYNDAPIYFRYKQSTRSSSLTWNSSSINLLHWTGHSPVDVLFRLF